MSIDFGGEFMKIAIVKAGVPMEIVLNKESQRKTPAAVSIRDGERFFGEPAVNDAMRYPKTSYRYLHEVIGKDFDNPLVVEFKKKYPYYEIERDPRTGSVLFVHDENTKYSPEELVGMILQKAKEYAETFAEQPITESVITVPPFFNQAERRAMLRAADLAGLKVLQLINDNTAVALNYGMFRRKSFNSTPSYYMFFDIGASATITTVVEYQVVKVKSATSGLTDTFPQLTIRGVGYDRTLGGSVFQRRLRDHLSKEFDKVKKTKKDVFTDLKAQFKLYKEAGRVKQVLSANVEHFAQVENLLDDEDFRLKVTREEFEALCPDLFDRIAHTVKEALDSSQITLSEISEVILMGGGTRVPKIQEVLKHSIKRDDLGKGINTDEAAALGAVYQAANLGKGFKAQKFNIKDGVLYPIQVDSDTSSSDEAAKIIKRTLFGRMQTYPQKKVMTFNKHVKDFSFEVNYGDLSFLDINELKELGNTTLETISLSGVGEAFSKHSQDGTVAKGIKAHFRLDESGIIHVESVSVFVTEVVEIPVEDEESTLSKLGKSFSKFFGGGDDKEEPKDGTPEEKPSSDTTDSTRQQDDSRKDDTTTTSSSPTKDEKPKTLKKEKQKNVIIKEDLKISVEVHDLKDPDAEKMKLAKKHLNDLRKQDEEKMLLDKVKNEIETFIFDTRDKLEQAAYIKCSTEQERSNILEALSTASDWMYELEDSTPRKVYQDKLTELHNMVKDLFDRVYEYQERPVAIEALNSRVNHSEFFLEGMKNFTAITAGDDQPFTLVEMETLKKLIEETKEWNATVQKEQSESSLTEKPKYTIDDYVTKINALDREIKYLIAKVKNFKPKSTSTNTSSEGSTSNTTTSGKKKKPKKTKTTTMTADKDGETLGLGGDKMTLEDGRDQSSVPTAKDDDDSATKESAKLGDLADDARYEDGDDDESATTTTKTKLSHDETEL
ncbi:hypothetical protein HELRODRAFT_111473 [Helobdella robusta]|uniref:Hypoxia up-regulated protein 1 n=1 Tax=Helobdella robusta TaxID=6412 RepID=T1EFB5_HELRO|nr:hypothetical protein HELRODRAFT_111473 [Helobdella robusta]ESO05028.1 hypothetical protein HELRODRAFT_111473 [Helobdella robusta]